MQPGAMLEKWFHDQLKDIFYAEKALLKALPKMRKAATTPQLQTSIEEHVRVTERQVQRLEQVFQAMGKRAQAKKCEAIEGLIKEGEEGVESTKEDTYTRDVAIIMSSQKIEHYEICAYGTLAQVARTMGNEQVARLLDETLQEEKEADRILTMVAENNINERADRESGAGAKSGGQQGKSQTGSQQGGGQRSGSR
jgi:ferritin-like metal-binding protein YciE